MKKWGCIILTAVLLLMLGGCKEPQSAPSSSTAPARYRITYQWTMLSNDSVGNNWTHTVTCDGVPISSGDVIIAAEGSPIILEGVITEDDKYPDTDSGTVTLTLADDASGSVRITVREGHGQYAGNTARWELTCRAAREGYKSTPADFPQA